METTEPRYLKCGVQVLEAQLSQAWPRGLTHPGVWGFIAWQLSPAHLGRRGEFLSSEPFKVRVQHLLVSLPAPPLTPAGLELWTGVETPQLPSGLHAGPMRSLNPNRGTASGSMLLGISVAISPPPPLCLPPGFHCVDNNSKTGKQVCGGGEGGRGWGVRLGDLSAPAPLPTI